MLLWLKATRPQFFTVIIFPIALGTVIAWHQQGVFLPGYFFLALIAGVFCHAGINVLNDYFDHLNQADEFNTEPLTPFAGGSRMIQNKLLSPAQTRRLGLGLLLATVAIGLYLAWSRGWGVLAIGLAGVLSGYFYSAPPLALNSRGWGELLVGLNFGVLAVLGAYYVQVQHLQWMPLAASLPLAFLVAAILYINEFPDRESDQQAGKNTLVVRLGALRARTLFLALVSLSFISIAASVVAGILPLPALIALLALPLGVKATLVLYAAPDYKHSLIPGIQSTILLHSGVSVLLIAAFAARG
jgi:1,4-dihydroxy-2-naphthoate octaprenyltransferase